MKFLTYLVCTAKSFLVILGFTGLAGLCLMGIYSLLTFCGTTSFKEVVTFLGLCLVLALFGNIRSSH